MATAVELKTGWLADIVEARLEWSRLFTIPDSGILIIPEQGRCLACCCATVELSPHIHRVGLSETKPLCHNRSKAKPYSPSAYEGLAKPMIARLNFTPMAPQKYLEWESTQDIKHAYVNGEVFAITGGTIPHNQIALNLASALKAHLRGKGCLVVMADVKVEISQNGPYHYPDVMVSCDGRDRNAIKLIRYPSLIVEVLSPSTADYDRGDKFTHYRQIPTLQEYVLISADQTSVDRYRRISSRHWDLQTYIEAETLSLASVDWQAPIELLYEDVRFLEEFEEG